MLNKLRNNKILKLIGNIIYALAFILVILVLLVVITQRLSNNEISLGGYRIYNTATGSMIPEYEIGDILISKEVKPEEIQIGDDITYMSREKSTYGKLITHSVVDIKQENGEYKFVTRGIANSANDPEISEGQIYGKIVYKPVILSFINKLIRNIYAFYFLIIVPMAIIIARMLANYIINREEKKREKENNKKTKEEVNNTKKEENLQKQAENKKKNNKILNANIINKEEIIDIKKDKENENRENKKKTRKKEKSKIGILLLKKIKISHIIILIMLLLFNTLAWFIYATEVSTSLSAHVTSWDVEFASGEGEISNEMEINLDRIYPGMDTYENNIEVLNKGEAGASLSYRFKSITILGEKFEVGENMTSEELEEKIKNEYPFKINITKDVEELEQGQKGFFRITVEWPYESGNDELDTYWGNKAYEFYSLNPGEKSLYIELELIATQK